MTLVLSKAEIDMLLTSLRYSKQAIDDGSDDYERKQSRLREFEELAIKLREADPA
jgi:hypothetical protein